MATQQAEANAQDTSSSLSVSAAGDDLTKTVLIEFDDTKTKTDIEGALVKCVAAVREYLSTVTTG